MTQVLVQAALEQGLVALADTYALSKIDLVRVVSNRLDTMINEVSKRRWEHDQLASSAVVTQLPDDSLTIGKRSPVACAIRDSVSILRTLQVEHGLTYAEWYSIFARILTALTDQLLREQRGAA